MAELEFFKFKMTGPTEVIIPFYMTLWVCFLLNAVKLITIALRPIESYNELIVRLVGVFYPFSSILIEPVSWFI